MTAPASSRRRKTISRRNSWPPDSPRKLNVRKKYQSLKPRDALEPFWTNTYEWVTMERGPEYVRSAPLAKLAEFMDFKDDYGAWRTREISVVKLKSFSNERYICDNYVSSKPDVIRFYFVKNNKLFYGSNQKKNICSVRKSFTSWDPSSFSVRELNQTRFSSEHNNQYFPGKKTLKNNEYQLTNQNVKIDFNSQRSLYQKPIKEFHNEPVFNENFSSFQDSSIVNRSSRRQSNSVRMGDVSLQSLPSYIDQDCTVLKTKVIPKDVWNKENIKIDFDCPVIKVPNSYEKSRFSGQTEIVYKNPKPTKINNKNIKVLKPNPSTQYNTSEKYVVDKKIKSNPYNINMAPQDMDSKQGEADKSIKSPSISSLRNRSGSSNNEQIPNSPSGSNQNRSSSSSCSQGHPGPDESSNIENLHKVADNVDSNKKPNKTISKDKVNQKEKQIPITEEKVNSSHSTSTTIPANVLGFDFLTTLQDHVNLGSISGDTVFPASVIGHTFLNALLEQKEKSQLDSSGSKTASSSAVELPLLKTLVENATTSKNSNKPIPASIIGQAFLKNLADSNFNLEQSNLEPSSSKKKPELENTVSSTIIGQAFLKTLMDAQEDINTKTVSKPLPSSVIGQTFLKTLVESSSDPTKNTTDVSSSGIPDEKIPTQENIKSTSSSIPATVLGQTFLKNLLENRITTNDSNIHHAIPVTVIDEDIKKDELSTNNTENEDSKKVLPATVIGQSFLSALLQEANSQQEKSQEENIIPGAVIGQSFLKSLIESDPQKQTETDKQIPAPVVNQIFLKSLLESQKQNTEETEKETSESSKTLPATVIGRTFLKALIQEQPDQSKQENLPIPSNVIGQAFLKTLTETSDSIKKPDIIPAPVVSQAFMKSLIDQSSSSNDSEKHPVPASVVGQAFLKTLLVEENNLTTSGSEQSSDDSNKPVPSSVIGQTFLKSLTSDASASSKEDSCSKSIPSNVLGQVFLKTLANEQLVSKENVKKPLPAEVIGQVFLKCISSEDNSSSTGDAKESSKEKRVSFSLMKEASSDSEQTETSILASVVGLAFLKTLTSSLDNHPDPVITEEINKDISQAKDFGEAFLKTFVDLKGDSVTCKDVPTLDETKFTQNIESEASDSQFSEQEIEGQTSIIPPPPEFCSASTSMDQASATSSEIETDVASEIIGELLNYTKMMHSVIENMKDSTSSKTDTTSQSSHVNKND